MIKIIAHRGLWNHEEEQNANVAILRARDNKLGSEIDLYSLNQTIYCAHDMSKIHNNTLTYSLLDKELRDFDYFLDIKSLCMAKELKNIILDKKNKFLINVADDELKEYQDFGFSVYHSHNLSNSVTLPCVKHGLLADFWGSTKNYHKFIDTMKTYASPVFLISPEIHQIDFLPLWSVLKEIQKDLNNVLYLCTDFPKKAKSYFDL